MKNMNVLKVDNLSLKTKEKQLLTNISFQLKENTILGIVGESGSGKSMLCKTLLGLHQSKDILLQGHITYNSSLLTKKDFQKIRGSDIGLIQQNPMTAFNPVIKLKHQLMDVYRSHNKVNRKRAYQEIKAFVATFGFEDVDHILESYPHQLSGGMLQRLCIANLLLIKPKVVIADEITTALDTETKRNHQLAVGYPATI